MVSAILMANSVEILEESSLSSELVCFLSVAMGWGAALVIKDFSSIRRRLFLAAG
jgi:hypothetical protein